MHFSHQNTTIFYQDIGAGQPVLCLHGFGEDGNIWERQAKFLQPHFRLIIPDIPGSGKSTDPGEKAAIVNLASSIDGMADYFLAFIHFLNSGKSEKFVVLGHSMGGYIALAMAEKNPALLAGFGLVHSSAFADSAAKKETRKKSIGFIEKNSAYLFLRTSIPGLFGQNFKTHHTHEINMLVEKSRAFEPEYVIAYYKAMGARPDRTHVLSASKIPVLFVIGPEDIAAPMEEVLTQTHLPLIAHVNILPGVGHMGMLEATDQLNAALKNFISNC